MTKLRDAFPSVGFGTSGVRALVADLSPEVVSGYARAFARQVAGGASGSPRAGAALPDDRPACLVGWDLRPSSPDIAAAVCAGLEAEGVDPAWLDQVFAPIGLDIGAETPEEIAVAILGEIIKLRRGGSAASLSLRAR